MLIYFSIVAIWFYFLKQYLKECFHFLSIDLPFPQLNLSVFKVWKKQPWLAREIMEIPSFVFVMIVKPSNIAQSLKIHTKTQQLNGPNLLFYDYGTSVTVVNGYNSGVYNR